LVAEFHKFAVDALRTAQAVLLGNRLDQSDGFECCFGPGFELPEESEDLGMPVEERIWPANR
jgi:hypothetical protein